MEKILESVKEKLSFLSAIFILPICRLVLGEKAFNELVKENNENTEKQVLKDAPAKTDKKEIIKKEKDKKTEKSSKDQEIIKSAEEKENDKNITQETLAEKKADAKEQVDLNDEVPEDMIPKAGDIVTPDCEYDYVVDECYETDGFSLQESLYDMMEQHCEMEQSELYTMPLPIENDYPYYDTLEGQGDLVNDFREMLADAEYCDDVIVPPENIYDKSTIPDNNLYDNMTLDEIEHYDITENNYYMEMAENMSYYEDYDYDR